MGRYSRQGGAWHRRLTTTRSRVRSLFDRLRGACPLRRRSPQLCSAPRLRYSATWPLSARALSALPARTVRADPQRIRRLASARAGEVRGAGSDLNEAWNETRTETRCGPEVDAGPRSGARPG